MVKPLKERDHDTLVVMLIHAVRDLTRRQCAGEAGPSLNEPRNRVRKLREAVERAANGDWRDWEEPK